MKSGFRQNDHVFTRVSTGEKHAVKILKETGTGTEQPIGRLGQDMVPARGRLPVYKGMYCELQKKGEM
jgi:hypothetical protein